MDGLCMLCKEQITNPLTIENVGKHIELWLPEDLRVPFLRVHTVLTEHVQSLYLTRPVNAEQLVCIHCYIKEVFQWLKRADDTTAERFLSLFSFGYNRESFVSDRGMHLEECPFEGSREFGLCDECGEYGDTLASAGGEWLCEDCADYE